MDRNGQQAHAVSAFRDGNGWTRACKHQHPNDDEAQKCARKRNASIVVYDPQEISGKAAIAPAKYLKERRDRQRTVDAAERIARGEPRTFILRCDGRLDIRLHGYHLAEASSRREHDDVDKTEWTEISIYRSLRTRLPDHYAIHKIGRTSTPGRRDKFGVVFADSARDVVAALRHPSQGFLTNVAMDALRAAATTDSAFQEALVEDAEDVDVVPSDHSSSSR